MYKTQCLTTQINSLHIGMIYLRAIVLYFIRLSSPVQTVTITLSIHENDRIYTEVFIITQQDILTMTFNNSIGVFTCINISYLIHQSQRHH